VMGNRFVSDRHFDLVHIFLEFECGVTSHIHVSWVASNKARLLQVSAEAGSVVFDDIQPVEKIKVYSEAIDNRVAGDDSQSVNLSYRPGDIFIPALSRDEPLSLECNHFIECIKSGATPINGSDIGVEVVSVLEQITKALQSEPLSVEELR
jgi:predicted dehydrogenase